MEGPFMQLELYYCEGTEDAAMNIVLEDLISFWTGLAFQKMDLHLLFKQKINS